MHYFYLKFIGITQKFSLNVDSQLPTDITVVP